MRGRIAVIRHSIDLSSARQLVHAALAFLSFICLLGLAACAGNEALLFREDTTAAPHGDKDPLNHITDYSLEELMEFQFTGLLKKPTNVFDTPAAAFSDDHELIERSGAITLPDALRNIPGLQVAQHNAHSWSVTSRGFDGISLGVSGQFANKFLVMQDGRSLYTPLFSGVSWEAQDVLLDDIERIEVIRGPGASLWGSNAVNGIINIISKDARDSQGGLVTLGAGSEYNSFSHFRYGGMLGGKTYYRVFGKWLNVDNLGGSADSAAQDSWHTLRAGFRSDTHLKHSTLTFTGQIYDVALKATNQYDLVDEAPYQRQIVSDDNMSGAHLLGRLRHNFSDSSQLSLQVYFDRVDQQTAQLDGRIDTYDIDIYGRHRLLPRHEIMVGAGYRLVKDSFGINPFLRLDPASRNVDLFSAFVQDEFILVSKILSATVGSKFEHNEYTGFEVQPSFRLLWKPEPDKTVWLAASRAIRTPSRSENDLKIVTRFITTTHEGTPVFLRTEGNDKVKSEKLVSLEAGYRWRRGSAVWDATAFYHIYNDLRADSAGVTFPQPLPDTDFLFIPALVVNSGSGSTYGFELSGQARVAPRWEMQAAYSFFDTRSSERGFGDLVRSQKGRQPRHQVVLSSLLSPLRDVQTDLRMRYVGEISARNVPDYFTLDLRLMWSMTRNASITLVGQNLIKPRHVESSDLIQNDNADFKTQTAASEVQRGIFTKLTVRF